MMPRFTLRTRFRVATAVLGLVLSFFPTGSLARGNGTFQLEATDPGPGVQELQTLAMQTSRGELDVPNQPQVISFIDTSAKEQCMDINVYLWENRHDYTSLPSTMSIFAVIYGLIVSLGVVGNTLVILSVAKHRALQSVRNMFIVSLSCSDIVVSVVSGTITPISAFTKVWLFGATLCKLVPLIQGVSLCFSTLTLTAISIDRFILIIYPTQRSIQKKHALRMIVFNCVIATCISCPMYIMQDLDEYEHFCGVFCAEDWGKDPYARSTYGTVVFILQFVIPFFIITFCYMMISLRLSKGILLKRTDHKVALQSEQRRMALKRRLRTNRMLMAMVGAFVISWTPAVAFNFLRDYNWLPGWVTQQEYLSGVITHCISMSSTIWNPVLYVLLNEQWRLAFVDLIRSCKTKASSTASNTPNLQHRLNHRSSRLMSNAFIDNCTAMGPNSTGSCESTGGKWRYSAVSMTTPHDVIAAGPNQVCSANGDFI